REPGPGHLAGRLRDRRDLLGPAPGDRVRRLQGLAGRALKRAGDDVAAALRLRGLTQAAAASRVTNVFAASTGSGGSSTCIGASILAIHTRNSCDHDPRVLTMHAVSPSGSTVA